MGTAGCPSCKVTGQHSSIPDAGTSSPSSATQHTQKLLRLFASTCKKMVYLKALHYTELAAGRSTWALR